MLRKRRPRYETTGSLPGADRPSCYCRRGCSPEEAMTSKNHKSTAAVKQHAQIMEPWRQSTEPHCPVLAIAVNSSKNRPTGREIHLPGLGSPGEAEARGQYFEAALKRSRLTPSSCTLRSSSRPQGPAHERGDKRRTVGSSTQAGRGRHRRGHPLRAVSVLRATPPGRQGACRSAFGEQGFTPSQKLLVLWWMGASPAGLEPLKATGADIARRVGMTGDAVGKINRKLARHRIS